MYRQSNIPSVSLTRCCNINRGLTFGTPPNIEPLHSRSPLNSRYITPQVISIRIGALLHLKYTGIAEQLLCCLKSMDSFPLCMKVSNSRILIHQLWPSYLLVWKKGYTLSCNFKRVINSPRKWGRFFVNNCIV